MACPHGTPDTKAPSVIICRADAAVNGAQREWAACKDGPNAGGWIVTTWWCARVCAAGKGGAKKKPLLAQGLCNGESITAGNIMRKNDTKVNGNGGV